MTLQARIDALLEIQRKSQIEASLAEGALVAPMTPHVTAAGGVNTTYSGWLAATGEKVFHKPFSGVQVNAAMHYGHTQDDPPMHEVAAWRLARGIGPPWDALVPPSVLRDFPGIGPGSFTMGVTGVPSVPDPFTKAEAEVYAAAFWDGLVAQQDRHMGNYRWDDSTGRLNLIDHGFCFALPGQFLNATVFLEFRHGRRDEALTPKEAGILAYVVASPNLFGLADIVDSPRADALRDRAARMLSAGRVLRPGEY